MQPFPPDNFPIAPGGAAPSAEAAEYARPGYGPPRRPPSDFGTQLRDWIDVIARGRNWVLGAFLAIAIPVTIYALLAPNVYQSTAHLFIESGPKSDLSSVLPGGSVGQQSSIADELYILQYAEDLAEATAAVLLTRAQSTASGEAMPIVMGADGELASEEVVTARVGSAVRIAEADAGVSGVRVTAVSRTPQEAAVVANLYANAYVARTQTSSRSSVSASRVFLEEQADSVAIELKSREDAARDFMSREGAVRLDEESSNLVSQLASLEAERDQARVETGMLSARITELRSQIADLEPKIATRLGGEPDRRKAADEARVSRLREELETIYFQTPSLRTVETPPENVAELQQQIATLERRIAQSSAQITREAIAAGGVDASAGGLPRLAILRDQLAAAQVELGGTRSRVDIINGRIASYQNDLDQVPSQTVELARLMRERQSTERLALSLEQRLQEARVAESAELGYAEVVREAKTPGSPSAPNRFRMILLGLAIGLGMGVVLAIGRDQLDQRIRRPSDLRDAGYPMLGVIPGIDKLIEEDFGGARTIQVNGREVDTRLITLLVPVAQASEAFRGLRTSVQFSRPDTVVQTLLITSGSPSEGKSTISANLAAVMAQSGRRTLLVDCDLRRSRAHKIFGINREPGLTDMLARGASGEPDAIQPVMVADDLYVLSAGSLVPNPSEHLGSLVLRQQLARFKEQFDIIILDAPPVMAATDAALLSTQVDGTILVAAAGQTKDFELTFTTEELQNVGAHILGVVLNRFDVSKEYGYRYQYKYRYGNKYTYGASSS